MKYTKINVSAPIKQMVILHGGKSHRVTAWLIAKSVKASGKNLVIAGTYSGLLFTATYKNPLVVNTICISSFRYTHVITSTEFQLK